jgi:HPt (histidine-containing phosphotransfer) domain-containing protein
MFHHKAANIDELRTVVTRGDQALAKRLVHTLKGEAGSIGATRLQQAALSLENGLKRGESGEQLEARIDALTQASVPVFRSIGRLIASESSSEEAPGESPLYTYAPLLSRLLQLLEQHDADAIEQVKQLLGVSAHGDQLQTLKRITELVNDFQFDAALPLVEKLLAEAEAENETTA